MLHINSAYDQLTEKQFKKEKFFLQRELLELQEWIVSNDLKLAVIFEGRDAAGKGAAIRMFTQHLNTKYFRIEELGKPTEKQNRNWFRTFYNLLPKKGEIVFFDRSWYSRALIQPTMNYCTANQYKYFMSNVLNWERQLHSEGIFIIKFYLSVDKGTQWKRFQFRKNHELKYWKLSKNDIESIEYWGKLSWYKNKMFYHTSSKVSPWVIVNANIKTIAQLNCMRYLLSKFEYDNKKKLKQKKWSSTESDRDIEIKGVMFEDLNDEQYHLLSLIRQSL